MGHKIFLQSLHLTNFATFQNGSVHFSDGFNAIIGETGSGKSLILDALQFIFGQRADKKFIRKNSEFSIIEAHFKAPGTDAMQYFDECGHPCQDDIIQIKRILYQNGSSKAYLNFQLSSLQTIQNFSKRFVDFVGQFENQKLLSSSYQIVLLDKYCSLEKKFQNYQGLYKKIQELKTLLHALEENNKDREQKIDYVKFQIEEISKLNPSCERENELIEKKQYLQGLKESQEIIFKLNQLVSSDEDGLLSRLLTVQGLIQKNDSLFSHKTISQADSILSATEELSYEIAKMNPPEDNDHELEDLLNELDIYQKLKRKFGGSTEALMKSLKTFQDELEQLNTMTERIETLEKQLHQDTQQAITIATELHKKRCKGAGLLSKELTQKIRQLKMDNASIEIQCLQSQELLKNGMTHLKFMARTNIGEHFEEVKKIASGGELSRILLAFRQALSSKDSISIFLFDEIDSGVGGETAMAIGKALKQVAAHSQVIAITHLPQIAYFANKLISVNKEVKIHRTHSMISEYTGADIKKNVRKMSPL